MSCAPVLLSFIAVAVCLNADQRKTGPRANRRVINPASALEKVNDASDISPIELGHVGVRVVRAQILMDRAHYSPGEIDGRFGPDLKIAVMGFQERHKLKPTGTIDKEMWTLLNSDAEDLLMNYSITNLDIRDPIVTIPSDVMEQAKLKRMGFQSSEERIGERFHLAPQLLLDLNPGKKFNVAREVILVPNIARISTTRATRVIVSKSKRTVTAINGSGKAIAQFPATMGGEHDPLPVGSWKITVIQPNPVFYYNPKRFWNAKQDSPQAQIPPGPNNPAGTVWIGISKPHYGIHGSPEPGSVRRTESYGCIRLTNWDASDLAKMVRVGTPVLLEE